MPLANKDFIYLISLHKMKKYSILQLRELGILFLYENIKNLVFDNDYGKACCHNVEQMNQTELLKRLSYKNMLDLRDAESNLEKREKKARKKGKIKKV